MLHRLLQYSGIFGLALIAFVVFVIFSDQKRLEDTARIHPADSVVPIATSSEEAPMGAKSIAPVEEDATTPVQESQPASAAQSQEAPGENEVRRTQNPYTFPAKSEAELYATARSSIVNIFCQGRPIGTISGSGVVIDPRGIILTNAHVAQYLLLTASPDIKLQCFIRTGSPAENRYTADILYLSPAWIAEHADDVAETRAKGTGEHDYAFLLITKTVDGSPLPSSFRFLPTDTREAIAFTSDSVLLAGYPAEFAGGTTRSTLYPTSIFTRVGNLLTFGERSVDLISLGGAVLAQSGSSGGAVINLWGHLVGIITTTSAGETTAERELRAITLAYINRDISIATGMSLSSYLSGDISANASLFMQNEAPALAQKIIDQLP